jgi:molecular chaperone HscA
MARISIDLKSAKVKKQSNIIIGIDLGTTNSLVAYINDGKPVAVKDANGKNTLVPSVIHFDDKNKVIVGEKAKQKLITNPERTIYSVKRLMGKSFTDVNEQEQYFGYKIINEDEDKLVKIKVGNKFYTPIELSAEILKELKTRIEKELDAEVTKAVITVPAYFNDTQRQATRDAGKLAGLDVLRIVNEPTAASLAYGVGMGNEVDETVAIYDLGGGTFDISILDIQNGIFDVLATNGNTYLGGDDFDKAIMKYWIDELELSISDQPHMLQALRLEAEKAKKTLSFEAEYEGNIDELSLKITRTKFEDLIRPLVQKTIDNCEAAMKDAELNIDSIHKIIMVGGSTRVPLVNKMVADFFKKPVYSDLDPDEVVALGAAIQADVLAGNQKDILLLDVTPLSLGIETMGGLMDTIIPRNSKVPTKAGRNYTTSIDGQVNLKVSVYQGERDLVEHNRKLGEFILSGIPPMPANLPKIEIQFMLDADGILRVKAMENRSGTEQEIEIRSQYGVSEEEMALMLLESIKNAESDMKKRALLEARIEGKNIVMSSKKFLQQNKEILSEEELQNTKLLTLQLQSVVDGEDKDLINEAMEQLNTYTHPLAHRAMDHTIANAMKGKKL